MPQKQTCILETRLISDLITKQQKTKTGSSLETPVAEFFTSKFKKKKHTSRKY